jgi:Holliday junction resolvase RusA-like endonuclease
MIKPKTGKLKYPKGDLDNYVKLVLDALNRILYHDDKQIVSLHASKQYSNYNKIIIEWEVIV